ncbi:MAG: ATP-binding protein [Bacilli bacterium]|jgi:PAS domain S-box-containing protein|nr:ATP-binding protein [Bacilli bacterium]
MELHTYPLTEEERQTIKANPLAFAAFRVNMDKLELVEGSEAFLKIFPLPYEILKKDFYAAVKDLTLKEDRDQVFADFQLAEYNHEGILKSSFRLKGAEGDYTLFSINGQLFRLKDETVLIYCFISQEDEKTKDQKNLQADNERKDILFERILSTTKTAIFWKDSERRFLGANRAFLDYYGFKDEKSIIGKNDEDMGWHSDPDPFMNDEIRVLKEGVSTYRVEGKCFARGKERNIVASKSPIIVQGKILGLVGSFEDVTLEKGQEKQISDLNEKLKQAVIQHERLMEVFNVIIVKISLKDFSFVENGEAMLNMLGLSQKEFLEKYDGKFSALFQGEYQEEFTHLQTSISSALADKRASLNFNMKVPAVYGPIWISGALSFSDYLLLENKPASFIMVCRDVSQLVLVQKKLAVAEIEAHKAQVLERQSHEQSMFIDEVPSGLGALLIKNGQAEERIRINKFLAKRIALDEKAGNIVPLEDFVECIHPDERESFMDNLHQTINLKGAISSQYRLLSKAGTYFYNAVRFSYSSHASEQEVVYFAFSDITEIKEAESKVLESQHFYREVVRAAKLSTWVYDIKTHSVEVDEEASPLLESLNTGGGLCVSNLPDSLLPYIEPKDRERLIEIYKKIERGEDATGEFWLKSDQFQGSRCERINYIVEKDEDGKPIRAIGLGQDVTREKNNEERYKREIRILKEIDEGSLLSKGHFNLTKNLVLEYVSKDNDVFKARPFGSYNEAIKAFTDLLENENEKKKVLEKIDPLNLMLAYQNGEMTSNIVYHCRIDGQLPSFISLNLHTYLIPETGDLELFTYAYDITDKVENDRIMSLISERDFDYIGLIFSKENKFEFIKKTQAILFPEVRQLTDYSTCCSYVKKNFVNDDEIEQFEKATSLSEILEGLKENGHHVANYHRTESGKVLAKQLDYFWLEKEYGIILVVRADITASFKRDQEQMKTIQKAKLEADKANEAKSAFLSSMSHDLRTPLNGVLGFTKLALKEKDPEKKEELMRKVDLSGKLLLDLINDTLELSRIESGKSANEPEICTPNELLPAVITALRPSAELKQINLEVDMTNYPTAPLWCDRLKIQKIFLNLLSNAIKYTQQGGKVSVCFKKSSAEKKHLIFLIKDNGIGMSEEFMKIMYEPFSQENRSEVLKVSGTGLGLSLVKRLVDLLGGRISCQSELHKGTSFEVDLPYEEIKGKKITSKEAEEKDYDLTNKRVLLCEDNQMNQEIATMLLNEKGAIVDWAVDGQEGVKKFTSSPDGFYSLILMDMRMPHLDGLQATKAIRALERFDAKLIPIIAMTADAFEESVKAAKEAGMNGYLTKPIIPEKMFALIGKLCSK